MKQSAANLPADCLNLGQGYMNFSPPEWVTDAADQALRTVAPNHYSHPKGRIRLREAIKNFYGPSFGRELDVESEIIVTSGANEGEPTTLSVSSMAVLLMDVNQDNIPSSLLSSNRETKS